MKRVLLAEVEDKHLHWFQQALDYSVESDSWLPDWASGEMQVWEIPGGMIGLRVDKQIWVEFLVGRGLDQPALMEFLKGFGKNVEGFVIRPGLVRRYQQLGFKALGTYMRFENGR